MKVLELTVSGQSLRFRDEGQAGLLYNPVNGCSALVTGEGLLMLCAYVDRTLQDAQRAPVADILSALELPVPQHLLA